jgi:hypothetical protein
MTIMEKHASATTYVGSGAAVLGGLSANEIAAYGGLLIGVLGLLINWYYKAKEDRRAERALECKP